LEFYGKLCVFVFTKAITLPGCLVLALDYSTFAGDVILRNLIRSLSVGFWALVWVGNSKIVLFSKLYFYDLLLFRRIWTHLTVKFAAFFVFHWINIHNLLTCETMHDNSLERDSFYGGVSRISRSYAPSLPAPAAIYPRGKDPSTH
jgi:hypothetical protein